MKYCLLTTTFLLFIILNPVFPEIHRARSMQTFKHRFRNADQDGKSQSAQEPSEWTKWLDEKVWGHTRRVWLYSSISAGLVGLAGLFPLLVIPMNYGDALRSKESNSKLQMLLSFAVGSLLGDVFLHLLPEAWAHVGNFSSPQSGYRAIGVWFLAGLLSFYFVEKLFGDYGEKEGGDDKGVIAVETSGKAVCNEETCSVASDDSNESDATHSFARSIKKERGQINYVEKVSKSEKKRMKKGMKKGSYNMKLHKNESEFPLSGDDLNGTLSSPSSDLKDDILPASSSSLPAIKFAPSLSMEKKKTNNDIDKSEERIKISGYLNLLANIVDNFTHGLAVAGSYCISSKMGVLTTLAILLHEIPHEIGDFAILLQAGFDRWKAAKAQLLTASGGLIGAMIALSAESVKIAGDSTAWILPFTAGGFVNIALVAIIPDLLKETNSKNCIKQLMLICAGISVMGLVTVLVD